MGEDERVAAVRRHGAPSAAAARITADRHRSSPNPHVGSPPAAVIQRRACCCAESFIGLVLSPCASDFTRLPAALSLQSLHSLCALPISPPPLSPPPIPPHALRVRCPLARLVTLIPLQLHRRESTTKTTDDPLPRPSICRRSDRELLCSTILCKRSGAAPLVVLTIPTRT